uniref:Cytochrome P450 n=2 Tax=Clastoptera arizonana TaxID=38151 RepID=A0A1B6C600_9HEMI
MMATNNTENVTYEIVQGMKYLDQVISENLRKHTPLLYFTRKVTRDYRIPGTDVVLNKNVGIIIPSYAIHNDPKYYPEPRKFDPERFSEQNASKLKKFTYMPFGGGPRLCVAKRFALLEQKITLTRLLPRFRFGVCEKTEYPLDYEPSTMFPIPKKGIWLKVERLQK